MQEETSSEKATIMWRRAILIFYAAFAAALLVLTSSTAARADRAIVVGVQAYPQLPEDARRLKGCVADAEAMAKVLEKRGFTVTRLTDTASLKPTKEQILTQIGATAKVIKPGERFVFYFAGHGTDLPVPALLTWDATLNVSTGALTNALDTTELYAAVLKVPSANRAVILDSCFSGAMSKSLKFAARYYSGSKSLDFSRASSGSDLPPKPPTAPQTAVCYLTSAQANEKALEGPFGAGHHGVFTYHLLQILERPDASQDLTWGKLLAMVKDGVITTLEADIQHPTLSTPFLDLPVLGGSEPKKPVPPSTLWELYQASVADPTRIKITLDPDKTLLRVKEKASLTAGVGMEGYLVLLDRYRDDKLYLLFPDPVQCNVDQARVSPALAAKTWALQGDEAGSDRVKAFLFTDREQAKAVIQAFRGKAEEGIPLGIAAKTGTTGAPLTGAKRVILKEITPNNASAPKPFYTSELSLEFVHP